MQAQQLRNLVLGLALGTFGLSAAAVNVPHVFSAGNTISAAKMNENFATVKKAIDALETPNSITASQIKDEPGVAQATQTFVSLGRRGAKIESVVVNAPGPGFVLAMASFTLSYRKGDAPFVEVNFGLLPSGAGSLGSNQIQELISVDSGKQVVSLQCIFAVSGQGFREFSLFGKVVQGAAEADRVALSAVFFPSSYGVVRE